MAVLIGSARIDERGQISGGSRYNNASKEVSTQDWYLHSKGWYVLRPKDPVVAEKIAKNMEAACESIYIGYDQSQNNTLYEAVKSLDFDISKLKTYCETDCARLVRVCVLYAGVNVADFYTGNAKEALLDTGEFILFTSNDYCKSDKLLKRGDIAVTRTKGHIIAILSDGSGVSESKPVTTTNGDVSENVKKGQAWLNDNYGHTLESHRGEKLKEDGDYGTKTRAACVCVWKDVANRKFNTTLTPEESNFGVSSKKVAKKAQIEVGDSGTFTLIAQLILSAKGFYTGKMDAKFGSGLDEAVRKFQDIRGLEVDGVIGANTWYALFN